MNGEEAVDLGRLTLEEVVAKTADLPALPAATLAVMREAQSASATAHSVSRYLMQDQALTARVLRLANSAFYGMQRRIASPEDAIVILGMRAVRNLAMIASTYHWMTKPLKGYSIDPYRFWEHSLAVAVASQVVAAKRCPNSQDLAFTCGLLHDLGKVALSAWLENRGIPIAAVAAKLDLTVEQAERRVFGFDHQEVGSHLAENWNLPKPIVESILYHHRPSECFPDSETVDIVHVADYLSMAFERPAHGGEGLRFEFDEGAARRLGFKPDELGGLEAEYLETFQRYGKLFDESLPAAA